MSDLELVEDILKEINFNEDWYELGIELGVCDERPEYCYPRNFSNLKGCLRKWLSPGTTTSNFHRPTILDGLADALKRIGYSEVAEYGYSEAAEYIVKTCKLIMMFNDQYYYIVS